MPSSQGTGNGQGIGMTVDGAGVSLRGDWIVFSLIWLQLHDIGNELTGPE